MYIEEQRDDRRGGVPRPLMHLGAGLLSFAVAALTLSVTHHRRPDLLDPGRYVYVCVTSFVCGVTLSLLIHRKRTRDSGIMFLLAYVMWNTAWFSSWDFGPFPMVGEFGKSMFFMFSGVAALGFPTGQIKSRVEWLWIWQYLAARVFGLAVRFFLGEPEGYGYSHGVWWPDCGLGEHVDHVGRVMVDSLRVFSAVTFVGAIAYKVRNMRQVDIVLTVPLLASLGFVGLVTSALEMHATIGHVLGDGEPMELADAMRRLVLETPCFFVSLGILTLEICQAWTRNLAIRRVLELATPPTLENVRSAVSQVLGDPEASVALWLPEKERYVHAGEVRAVPGETSPAGEGRRWSNELMTHDGRPLAVVSLERSLTFHTTIVAGAMSAAQRVLETIQMQESLAAQERESRRRVVAAENRERARIQRDLHDGAQQSILATCTRLGIIEAQARDPAVSADVRECRLQLLGSLAELRRLSQGIHPLTLIHEGLGAALELVAERLGVRIRLSVPEERFEFAVESVAYFTLGEAMANAVKHSRGSRIEVSVRASDGVLIGTVTDDGVGGARMREGGGLAGIADRLRGVDGSMSVESREGRGTSVRIEIPCEC